MVAYFFKGHSFFSINAETHLENFSFTSAQSVKYRSDNLTICFTNNIRHRVLCAVVSNQVAHTGFTFIINRSIERSSSLRQVHNSLDLIQFNIHMSSNLLISRSSTELLSEFRSCLLHFRQKFNHIGRNADSTRLVSQSTRDSLTNPVSCIGRESETLGTIIFLSRLNQTEIALLDEVKKRQAATIILLCDRYNKKQITFNQSIYCISVSCKGLNRKFLLLVKRQTRVVADRLQISLYAVKNNTGIIIISLVHFTSIFFRNHYILIHFHYTHSPYQFMFLNHSLEPGLGSDCQTLVFSTIKSFIASHR